MNFRIKVINEYGKDVTKDYDWCIDTDGILLVETSDVDMPLQVADRKFRYEIIIGN